MHFIQQQLDYLTEAIDSLKVVKELNNFLDLDLVLDAALNDIDRVREEILRRIP